jgi:hypothetical protein
MFMCVVNLKSVNKLDLTWKQSFLIDTISEIGFSLLTELCSGLMDNLVARSERTVRQSSGSKLLTE